MSTAVQTPRAASPRGRGVIGQNRLAIIDLVTGDPPITNEDGTVGAVLNGEIYNFRELRERAARRAATSSGRRATPRSSPTSPKSSTPVALAQRLDGMFAFAIWDDRRERLVLGRDRLGKKPLYYWARHGRLVFASEIKAVLAHPAVPRRLDPSAIPAYLTFGYVPTPRTFFDGIRSLPPGHVLTFEPGGEPVVERYWQPPRRRDRRESATSTARSTTAARRGPLAARAGRAAAADLRRPARAPS